jgi:hypothetical protein
MVSLQRGVQGEPDFRGRIPSATARERGKAADLQNPVDAGEGGWRRVPRIAYYSADESGR